jgi:diacylglycerol kinase (ATP)
MKVKSKFLGVDFALNGIFVFFLKERNARIHLLEWLWIASAIALVFITEMINSAIELLGDLITSEHNEKIGRLKDIAAGAVLVSAVFSLIVATIIFLPRIIV